MLILLLSGCSLGRKIDTSNKISLPYQDGTYKVISAYYDSYGFTKELILTVHDSILSQVSYTERNRNGELRSDLPVNQLKWADCELTYPQIIQNLYEETILRQTSSIDAISGATKTVDDYKILLDAGLIAAENGTPAEQILNRFSDTYTAVGPLDLLTGTQERITAVYKDGVLRDIQIQELVNNSYSALQGRSFSQLADISESNQSIEDVTAPSVDSGLVLRYNNLLELIRELREK